MFRKSLLAAALITTSTLAIADDYTFIGGGFQFGSIDNKQNFDKQFNQSGTSHIGSDKMRGFYLNGGYGFENNLFMTARLSAIADNDRGMGDGLLGVGYHFALTPDADMYLLAGASRHAMLYDVKKDGNKTEAYNSATGEVGIKTKLTQDIGLDVAYRLAEYDSKMYHEARIEASYALTQSLAAEVGYTYHNWKVDDQIGQVGLRYTF
ncbi:outer membrane beta-barrel protein [Yersinia nurmii]|uniref:Lipoprotein n=1 Tax=Yersinia nurmii TaxID=685706 RepID=A0AAW7K141_9GAMM|nr:outer membrane beta-barrel protein [Yersinia nurmii]MDN0086082.1 outer membrane beta-barrel protein [Yersinia nurmii]CND85754.1 putative lipoprotein [Yersinia nurmii]